MDCATPQGDRATLAGQASGVRAVTGNLAYYAGIDPANSTMRNISVWQGVEGTIQMAQFAPKLALAVEFIKLGGDTSGRCRTAKLFGGSAWRKRGERMCN